MSPQLSASSCLLENEPADENSVSASERNKNTIGGNHSCFKQANINERKLRPCYRPLLVLDLREKRDKLDIVASEAQNSAMDMLQTLPAPAILLA